MSQCIDPLFFSDMTFQLNIPPSVREYQEFLQALLLYYPAVSREQSPVLTRNSNENWTSLGQLNRKPALTLEGGMGQRP